MHNGFNYVNLIDIAEVFGKERDYENGKIKIE